MSNLDYFELDGEIFLLGLLPPPADEPDPRYDFKAYASTNNPMFTKEQKLEMLQDSSRLSAEKWFPNELFIKSQGGRGSCNGYAGAKALERARVKRGLRHIPLSGEGLYAQINGGRDGGSHLAAGMKAMTERGVPPESMVPHQEYLWNRISEEAREAMDRFKAVECYRTDTSDELESGLLAGFVGVVAVQASGSFNRLDENGSVYPSLGPGNHAVGVDDLRWNASRNEFEYNMFNSWGRRYGRDGRGWISWSRHLKSTNSVHSFFLIRSTTDDPQGQNPPIAEPSA